MLLLLSAYSIWSARGLALTPFHLAEAGGPRSDAGWELPLPLVVLGGIYGGLLAVSEAAAATAFYVFLVEVVIRREIPCARCRR